MTNQLPERRLLVAILERGALDSIKKGRIGRTAREWIYYWTREDFKNRYSFPWICLQLDLCPFSTRDRIYNLDQDIKTINPNFWSLNIIDNILIKEEEDFQGDFNYIDIKVSNKRGRNG